MRIENDTMSLRTDLEKLAEMDGDDLVFGM